MSTQRSKRNAERLRMLPAGILDAMHEPAAVLDATLRILNAGSAFCRFWGRSTDETEGLMLHELTGQMSAPTLKEIFAPALDAHAGPAHEMPEVQYDLSGPLPIRMNARRIDTDGNASRLILLTLTDLADGGRTAKVQDNEENRFRILADAAFEGIALTRGGVFVDLNDQLARMLGYRREELIGSPVVNCVAVEHRARVAGFMTDGRLSLYEHLALRQDGTTFPVEVQVRTSRIDGRETRITAIRDITDRKRAESELRANKEKIQLMVDHAGAILWTVDTDLRFTSTQGSDLAQLNLVRDQVVGVSLSDFFGTEDPEFPAISAHRRALCGESVTYEQTWGDTVFQTRLKPLYDAQQRIIGVSGVSINITERKQVEEALKLTQFTIDRASFGCSWIRRDGQFFYVNDQACRSLGYDRQELLQLSILDIDPEFDVQVWNDYWTLLVRDRVRTFETRHRHKDGSTFPVEITANYVVFGGDEYSCAFSTDISERKKIERLLELTQFAIDRASLACFWMEPKGRFFYVNDQACRSLGYSREELLQKFGYDIDPGFTPELCDECWQHIVEERVVTFETTHQRKDGTFFPVELTANYVEFDGHGYQCLFARDITENKIAEEILRRFQYSIDHASEAIFWMGREGDFLYVNDQACRSLGYSQEELMGLRLWDIDPLFPKERWQIQWQEMTVAGNRIFETIHRRKDGTDFPVEVSTNHIMYSETEHHHVAFVRDISYRKQAEEEQSKLEAQLNQAQKMESIGRLAGGVAHDFNNMLSVILGYAGLMKADLAADHPLLKKVLEIEKAANHSRDITSQLLAFSRKQVVSPQLLDLNRRVGDLQKTLARLIGEDIDLQVFAKDGLWTVRFDPTQIEQILINLAVNARDAMPAGGRLTIETENIHIDEAYCRDHAGFIPGDFVRLSVSDNGSGMEPETLAHVFEPFFTTKEVGKGTGLGLATVYGIVKQGGGFINAYSEPGQGTTFTIYLPRISGEVAISSESDDVAMAAGTETVLLVEDDDMVREMAQVMLERIGYTVQAVSTPEAALGFFESDDEAVDLLMTDVVMPEMNGKELRNRIAAIRPDIKTLFMSGYTANVIVQHGVLDEGVHFIQKPFSIKQLARMVRKALS